MTMSNSALVTYRHITSHKSVARGGKKIEKIFLHHMAGNLTVKQCGNVFDSRQASAHYGINGNAIGQYVDESDTAWHCGNANWNKRSIGIELANDGGSSTNWHVSASTIKTAIKLIADICRRNGIKELKYTGDMSGNLCMHRWVCSTACPGGYLAGQFSYIAKEVNKLLGVKSKLEVDGIGGELTVRRMQEFLGTVQDGVISGQKKANAKYYPALEAVTFDDTSSTCVKALQWMLGVYEDGIIGLTTVKAWQKFLGVTVDGIFGLNSMKAWQKYLNSHTKATYPATHAAKPVTTTVKKTTTNKNAQIVSTAKSYCGSASKVTDKYKKAANSVYGSGNNTNCHRFVGTVLAKCGFPKMPISGKTAVAWKNILAYFGKYATQVKTAEAGDIVIWWKGGTSYHIFIATTKTKKAESAHNKTYPHVTSFNPKTKHKKDWIFRMK